MELGERPLFKTHYWHAGRERWVYDGSYLSEHIARKRAKDIAETSDPETHCCVVRVDPDGSETFIVEIAPEDDAPQTRRPLTIMEIINPGHRRIIRPGE